MSGVSAVSDCVLIGGYKLLNSSPHSFPGTITFGATTCMFPLQATRQPRLQHTYDMYNHRIKVVLLLIFLQHLPLGYAS